MLWDVQPVYEKENKSEEITEVALRAFQHQHSANDIYVHGAKKKVQETSELLTTKIKITATIKETSNLTKSTQEKCISTCKN